MGWRWIVGCDEIDLAILKGRNEVKVAGEPVKFGHRPAE